MEMYQAIMISLLLIISSIWDIRTKKIPNAFIMIGILSAMAIAIIENGAIGFGEMMLTFIIAQIVFMLLWGVMGAGDIKLFIVLSLYLGIGSSFKILFYSVIIAAIFFIAKRQKESKTSIHQVFYSLFYQMPLKPVSKQQSIAFSPYILLGFIVLFFVQGGVQ